MDTLIHNIWVIPDHQKKCCSLRNTTKQPGRINKKFSKYSEMSTKRRNQIPLQEFFLIYHTHLALALVLCSNFSIMLYLTLSNTFSWSINGRYTSLCSNVFRQYTAFLGSSLHLNLDCLLPLKPIF